MLPEQREPRAFSPKPELVTKELRKSGFHRIRRKAVESHLIMKGDAARNLLANTKASFFEKHKKQLDKVGMELPDWVIISGVKSQKPHSAMF
jgi:hypothetical protein